MAERPMKRDPIADAEQLEAQSADEGEYEPPTVTILGSVVELTGASGGSPEQ